MYNFATLDPRNIPAAMEANDKIFAAGPVYGVEVTVPALAERCTFNLDPQHTGGDADCAAIEMSVFAELPAEGSTLATVRADLDAVGSMAILNLRARGESLRYAVERINMVADADKFARGGYMGPKPLPSQEEGETQTRTLAAIAAAVSDFKLPLADRVSMMERWLLTGEEPEQYRAQVERERLDVITALETGKITYESRSNGRIAVVQSTHRAATSIGYSLAPVVVALNPEFKQGSDQPYRKFTICAFEAKFANIKAALAELNELESGWGGSPTIGGSPQGTDSSLSIDQVVAVVEKHLLL